MLLHSASYSLVTERNYNFEDNFYKSQIYIFLFTIRQINTASSITNPSTDRNITQWRNCITQRQNYNLPAAPAMGLTSPPPHQSRHAKCSDTTRYAGQLASSISCGQLTAYHVIFSPKKHNSNPNVYTKRLTKVFELLHRILGTFSGGGISLL